MYTIISLVLSSLDIFWLVNHLCLLWRLEPEGMNAPRLKIWDKPACVLLLNEKFCVYFFLRFRKSGFPFPCTDQQNLHGYMELSVNHFLESWVQHVLISTLFQPLAYNKGHALSLRQDSDSDVQTGTLLVLASVACNWRARAESQD